MTSDPYRNLHDEDVERALLGSVLLHPYDYVLEDFLSVSTDSYWLQRHRVISDAIKHINEQDDVVDLVSLTDYLRRQGRLEDVGSIPYLTALAEQGSTDATRQYATSINDYARRRALVDFAGKTVTMARDQASTLTEVIGRLEQELTLAARNSGVSERGVDGYADAALAALEDEGGGRFTTGIESLDKVTGGLKGLVILGARPSMGKSALARDILRNQHNRGRKVALFTQDQYGSDVISFEASLRSKVPLQRVKIKNVGEHELQAWRASLREIRDEYRETYRIDDRPHNIFELANHIRSAARWGAELVVVDYLQLIDVPGVQGAHTVQATTLVSKTLKHLTQELNMPILALAQLSRAVEARSIPKPQLSDLRESGQIEQDAEAVIFLYRQEYYQSRADGRGEQVQSYADLIVAKNKTGPTGTARTLFNSIYVTFAPIEGMPF
jgi:replicative DNA helicase